MVSKNILIVTKYFYPDIRPRSFRAFELAKEFARQGHTVKVLTTKKEYDYSGLEKRYGFKVSDVVQNEPKEIEGGGLKRVLRFSLSYLFLYPFIVLTKNFKAVLKDEKGYDLLISIAHPYPVHFAVAFAKKKNKNLTKTFVADCGDPFVGNQHSRLTYPFYYRLLERWFCKRADFITVPIKEAISAYPKKYWHKINVIPQGFNFNDVKPTYIKNKNKVPTFAYAGVLSPGLRDPRPLLEFLIEKGINFKFVIYTKNKDFISNYRTILKSKLEIRDYVPRETLLKELAGMDFLLNLENKGNVQKPSKLIDYALLKRPILSLSPGKLDKEKVLMFLEADYSKALKVDNVDKYNIVNIAKRFLKFSKA